MRIFSVAAVLVVVAGLLALLFHDVDSVRVRVETASESQAGADPLVDAIITIPPGQRLPLAGTTLSVEETGAQTPRLLDAATCWGDGACQGNLLHNGRRPVVKSIELIERTEEASVGELWVRVEGFGESATMGYGAEVEPQRRLVASDIVDAEGREGFGVGYGGADAVSLRYRVTLDGGALAAGSYQLTFLVETGSRAMGPISSPAAPLSVG